MNHTEIFPNPTVQQVIFEIRFPNLFYIESKIGDYQLKIMDKFPNSQLVHHQQVLLTEFIPINQKGNNLSNETNPVPQSEKIWRFQTSDKTTTLDVKTASLHIVSSKHKTYNNEGASEKFRDILVYAISPFLAITSLPKITRIGLRYIDLCPWPGHQTSKFKSFYNSIYPTDRFLLEDTSVFDFATIVTKNGQKLRYAESLSLENDTPKYILDFDGSAEMISSGSWSEVTDKLHKLISDEYHKTILDPVRNIMRKQPEEPQ